MSLRAMTWALEDAPVTEPAALLVLWALADRAADDGTAAWPSIQWLAHRARCSTRTVQRHLRALEAAGIIRKGDQRHVQHLRADHRPTVWDLNLSARRGDTLSPRQPARGDTQRTDGVTPGASRGDTGVTQTVHEPSQNPSGASAPARTPADEVATTVYDDTGKAVKYVAVRAIARWALTNRNTTPAQVAEVMVGLHTAGKPITQALVAQVLDGHLRLATTASKRMDHTAGRDHWAAGGGFLPKGDPQAAREFRGTA